MSNQDNHLEEIERGLYSRTKKIPISSRRHILSPENRESSLGWAEDKTIPALDLEDDKSLSATNNSMANKTKKLSGSIIFLIIAGLFFLVALGFVGYSIFLGGNVISSENVGISITGPISISAGESLAYDVKISNNNSVDLTSLNYLVEYPDGTREVGDISKEFKREGNTIDTLKANSFFQKDFKAVLFGAENDTRSIKVTIEYRVPGSNAVFHKEKIYDVLISSAPVTVTVSGLKEITSGQTLTFNVEVRSNSTKVIKDLLLQAVFPFGFVLKKSTPEQAGLNVWNIGDLEPNGIRRLSFTGTMEGQDGEERTFKFVVGLKKSTDALAIGTPFFSSISPIIIQKPFIGVSLVVDGDTATEHIAKSNKVLRTDVLYQNNLPSKIIDAEISIKLKGNSLNRNSVIVANGYYSSIDNLIIFNKENSNGLSVLDPSDSGRLGFSFSAYPFGNTIGSNQEIIMEVTVKGRREEGFNVPQEVLSSTVKKIKIVTDLRLSSLISYTTGPFKNIGLLPPKAEKETSYTITWSLSNTFNDVGNVVVSANLPSYVRWLNNVSGGENVTYNPVGGEVIWKPKDIKSGVGTNSSPRQVSFQVSFLPSLSQVGGTPDILTNNVVRGIDKFTNTEVTDSQTNLTTQLNNEPGFNKNNAKVIQ
ncbi:MAG: hypothetical protein WAV11_00090 [Minisyncoccia bacterium]